jgi:O-antigen/teichoic acid export membrane protein
VTVTSVRSVTARRDVSRAVGRLSWGVVDQAVGSASNFALSLYVAREFGPRAFGTFSLAFITFTVILNASRGAATDPLMVRYSGATGGRWRDATAAASATGILVGAVAGVGCIVAGVLLPEPIGPALIALGVLLPGLMLQDSVRFAFFAAGRPRSALLNDVVWTVLLLLALVIVHQSGNQAGNQTDTVGVVLCLVAFGGTASIAALFGLYQTRVLPRPSKVFGWLREHRQLSPRYLLENVSGSGASQIRSSVLGGVAGLASVGYMRGAEILMGPFLVVLSGVSQVSVPEASRVLQRDSRRLPHFCAVLGGAQALAALAWGAVLLLVLPLGPGQLLLKDVWAPASQLIVPVTLNVCAACFLTAVTAGLRATGVARRSLRAQLTNSAVYLILGISGAILFGVQGACWAAVLATSSGVLVSSLHLRAALADHDRVAAAVS